MLGKRKLRSNIALYCGEARFLGFDVRFQYTWATNAVRTSSESSIIGAVACQVRAELEAEVRTCIQRQGAATGAATARS